MTEGAEQLGRGPRRLLRACTTSAGSERGGSSSGGDARRARFHRRFAAAALERGWLRLWIAEADGEPAAAWYGWRIGERYCYSLSGLDAPLRAARAGHGPARPHDRAGRGGGRRVYDLMWGDEGYKRRFETGRRQAATWVLAARAAAHPVQLTAAARTALERAKRAAAALDRVSDGVGVVVLAYGGGGEYRPCSTRCSARGCRPAAILVVHNPARAGEAPPRAAGRVRG